MGYCLNCIYLFPFLVHSFPLILLGNPGRLLHTHLLHIIYVTKQILRLITWFPEQGSKSLALVFEFSHCEQGCPYFWIFSVGFLASTGHHSLNLTAEPPPLQKESAGSSESLANDLPKSMSHFCKLTDVMLQPQAANVVHRTAGTSRLSSSFWLFWYMMETLLLMWKLIVEGSSQKSGRYM